MNSLTHKSISLLHFNLLQCELDGMDSFEYSLVNELLVSDEKIHRLISLLPSGQSADFQHQPLDSLQKSGSNHPNNSSVNLSPYAVGPYFHDQILLSKSTADSRDNSSPSSGSGGKSHPPLPTIESKSPRKSAQRFMNSLSSGGLGGSGSSSSFIAMMESTNSTLQELKLQREEREKHRLQELLTHLCYLNHLRAKRKPLYGSSLRRFLQREFSQPNSLGSIHQLASQPSEHFSYSDSLLRAVRSYKERASSMRSEIDRFIVYIPSISAPQPIHPEWRCRQSFSGSLNRVQDEIQTLLRPIRTVLRPVTIRQQLAFPEKRLIQYDCGKLQKLAVLLRDLKRENHRVLIFTQMTRVLNILEIFLNLHGYTYLRLDGATKPEQRQAQMELFNADPRIFAFILSTRSGGFGINLVGADTVIFYDSDWNPAMDQQAQDRCHRIGQTREVHIYRLISERTIEENILRKANQKRMLDTVAIEGGKFTTEFFQHVDLSSLVTVQPGALQNISREQLEKAMTELEDESDVLAMREAQKELEADREEFSEADLSSSTGGGKSGSLNDSQSEFGDAIDEETNYHS